MFYFPFSFAFAILFQMLEKKINNNNKILPWIFSELDVNKFVYRYLKTIQLLTFHHTKFHR